ncbi:MAG: exodeoxyribonuclease VII small subunit [Gammaproteobacteria bacterium]|nr:exodeoxyribonuclease VII small subunit [Gammaproteobacteria bacterium]|tara:strand:- start:883 stop:1152 length:270 start_codon:yes stop_codon:yes gene_type:complete
MPKKTPAKDAAADELADLDFETALAELETLVDQMEAGDMTLEASLTAFERGVKLTRHCQSALRDAELKIKKLSQNDELEPLDPEDFDDD